MASVFFSERFIDDVAAIHSSKVLVELDRDLALIEEFPEMGSTNVRLSLVRRFGEGLRKFPVSTFLVVYRYKPESDALEMLALPYAPTIT